MTFVTYEANLKMLSLAQEASMYKLHNDDCLVVLRTYPDNYFDSIVTDPPAGISFMGKDWDHDKGGRDQWIAWMTEVAAECLRTLKPGGHALVWSLPRTSHWTATAWENAGFEVRDRIGHIFGSGFPKSLDIGKAIDRESNTQGKIIGQKLVDVGIQSGNMHSGRESKMELRELRELRELSETAEQWNGWGTALKPAVEDWWLFRKPCSEKTVAANVLKWGTGALNIDACRVPGKTITNKLERWSGFGQVKKPDYESEVNEKGRWPAHLIHDGSDEVLNIFLDTTSGKILPHHQAHESENRSMSGKNYARTGNETYGDSGSSARFFYCAKPTHSERDSGLQGMKDSVVLIGAEGHKTNPMTGKPVVDKPRKNIHPTVKALSLMKYLIMLVTPPKGIVLDCFMGSGSTGVAAISLGFSFVGIEKDKDGYFEIAEERIAHTQEPML